MFVYVLLSEHVGFRGHLVGLGSLVLPSWVLEIELRSSCWLAVSHLYLLGHPADPWFKKKKKCICILYVWMLCLHVCKCTMCIHCWESLKVLDPLKLMTSEVTDGCKPLCWCWEPNLGPLEEQPVFFTAEPFLPLLLSHFYSPFSPPLGCF